MPSTAPPSRRPRVESVKSTSSSQWGVRPPSPTMSATTLATDPGFSHPPSMIVTRKDLRQSVASFEELMQHAKSYRQAVLALSAATSSFAGALEACSRVKGCNAASGGVMGASGLGYMMGSHEGLLGDTFYRQFEIPLLETLDEYRAAVADRQAQYERACHEKTAAIRQTEQENLRQSKRKRRDLQQFRTALATLQAQVNDLDRLKGEYHQEVLEAEDELWQTVLGRVAFFVRAQMEIYEKVSSKSTDPALEPLMSTHPDPFDAYGPPKPEGQLFSVLAPLGLMNGNEGAGPAPSLSRGSPAPASPSAKAVENVENQPRSQEEVDERDRAEQEPEGCGLFDADPEIVPRTEQQHKRTGSASASTEDDGEDGDFLRRRRERELSVIEDQSETGSVSPVKPEGGEPDEVEHASPNAAPQETDCGQKLDQPSVVDIGAEAEAYTDAGNDSGHTETPDQDDLHEEHSPILQAVAA